MDAGNMQSIMKQYLTNFENNMKVKQINSINESNCDTKQELDDKKTIGYYLLKNNTTYGVLRYRKTLYLMVEQRFYDIKKNEFGF